MDYLDNFDMAQVILNNDINLKESDLGFNENNLTFNPTLVAQYAIQLGYEYIKPLGWIKEDEFFNGEHKSDN